MENDLASLVSRIIVKCSLRGEEEEVWDMLVFPEAFTVDKLVIEWDAFEEECLHIDPKGVSRANP